MNRKIVLIGYMGSGKSTLGPLLAQRLHVPLVDLDQKIEQAAGKSIPEIFRDTGEQGFRDIETACLEEVLSVPGAEVICLGGGTPVRKKNRELLEQLRGERMSFVVYLETLPETVLSRIGMDSRRPMLESALTPEERLCLIRQMMAERDPFYRQAADMILSTDHLSPAELVNSICLSLLQEE